MPKLYAKRYTLNAVAGFTLIELLVVISLIGILTSIAYYSFENAQQKSRDARRKQDLKTVSTALLSYYGDKDTYPPICNPSPCSQSATYTSDTAEWIPPLVPAYTNTLPQDPKGQNSQTYTYTVAADRLSFELWAQLENLKDKEIIGQGESKCTKTPPDPKYNFCIENPK